MSDTKEYDQLPEREKDLIKVGYEVGYENGWRDRGVNESPGSIQLTASQEELFYTVLRKKLNDSGKSK